MATSLRPTLRNIVGSHAPVEWLMEINRKPMMIFLASAVFAILFRSIADLAYSGVGCASSWAGAVCGPAALGGLVIAKRFRMRLRAQLGMVVGVFLGGVLLSGATILETDDMFIRIRIHSINTAFWKSVPALFGFPLLPAAALISWTLVVDTGSWIYVHHHFGDPTPQRMYVDSFVVALSWIAVAWLNSGRLKAIYDAHEALAAEKALMDSIITMMCDGIVWLSENGSTIIRSDDRFKIMIGRDVTGEHVESSLAAGEWERLRLHLSEAKRAPVLLPTTLLTVGGDSVPVDMFIVGNRDVCSNTEGKAGFLIGIGTIQKYPGLRTASREGMETFQDADLNEEHMLHALDESAREDELQSASVPETTTTGCVFDRIDIDRWLEGSPQDRTDELKTRLEQVISLGQQERWLMSSKDVSISADHVLGAGAFGVVVGGRLHGSPVAVKRARHSADAAGAAQLVAAANEIRILRHVRHPNVALFHGACIESVRGEIMLVLERVHGPDLHQYVVARSADAEASSRLKLLLDVACAVRYLHAQQPQIAHGDLKGSNILVEEAVPRAKLVDFGLSRLLTKSSRGLGGSINWMAPEVISGKSKPKVSADVFSFGRVAYMVIACRKPLEGVRRQVIVDMARRGLAHTLVWEEGRPLHREGKGMYERLSSPVPDQRPSMAEVHEEASAWTLPDVQECKPSSLPAAIERGALRVASGAGFLHDVLSFTLRRGRAPAAGGEVAVEVPAARADLALPGFLPTKEGAKKLMLVDLLLQWNFPVPPGCCCRYHAAVAEAGKVGQALASRPCKPSFRPHDQHQCSSCGVMDVEIDGRCEVCSNDVQRPLGSIQEEDAPLQRQGEQRCSL